MPEESGLFMKSPDSPPPSIDRSDGPKVAEKRGYVTISLTKGIADVVDELMEELGYWPSRGAFVREAALEKIQKEQKLLQELGSHGEKRSDARNRSVGETGKLEEKKEK